MKDAIAAKDFLAAANELRALPDENGYVKITTDTRDMLSDIVEALGSTPIPEELHQKGHPTGFLPKEG